MVSQLGELLRQRRETMGLTFTDLQARTKIRVKYLEAIEKGDFDVIPGEVYLRGFIRSIASELGIDQQEAMQLYHQDIAPQGEEAADLSTPAPMQAVPVTPKPQQSETLARSHSSSRRNRQQPANASFRILWILLLVGVVVVGVFLWDRFLGQPLVEEDPDLLPPVDDPVKKPEPPTPTVQIALQDPQAANPVYLVHPGPLEVVLTAEGDTCWVGAKADTTSQQMTLNPKGQASLTLEAQELITVRVGKPSALRLTINGLDQGIIGGNNSIDLTVKLKPSP